jgi:PAS domain S-box-containing protein
MIFETVHRAKDGAEFPVEVSLNRIACGDVVYGCAFARDISERKQAEQALTQVAREWSAAMDASDDVIYILDLNRHLVRANKAFYLATGTSPEAAVGRHIMELFHPKREPFSCPVCRAQEERRDLHLIMEADSPENLLGARPIEVTSKMVRDQDGRPLSILTTLHDLTAARQEAKERGLLEKQLQQAQKMEAIGTLAGGVAHDFNNILTPILGYTEMALATVPPESETAGELKEVFKAAKRAAELVRQILAFSRQGEQQLQPLKVQLVIKEALKLLRSSIPTSIEFKQRIDPECGAVLADPTQIHQIIMNLCTNAYHAMRETGGALGITLSQVELGPQDIINKMVMKSGRYLMLEVSDTGHGMSKAVLERVFEPYFTTKETGEGTGLGLAVVHGIVKKLAGAISAYSEPGKGSNFHVYLPMLETERQGGAAEIPGPLPRGSERILVVDDEEVVARLLQDMLGGLGYQVSGFTTPEEALAVFRAQPQDFDLILTDMTMPRITGDRLAQEILALRPGTPVIICTGFSELLSEEKARALNIRKMLMKPVLLRELAMAVREVLETQEH